MYCSKVQHVLTQNFPKLIACGSFSFLFISDIYYCSHPLLRHGTFITTEEAYERIDKNCLYIEEISREKLRPNYVWNYFFMSLNLGFLYFNV